MLLTSLQPMSVQSICWLFGATNTDNTIGPVVTFCIVLCLNTHLEVLVCMFLNFGESQAIVSSFI